MAVFNLLNRDAMLPADNILQERYVISAAWKELGAAKVEAVAVSGLDAKMGHDASVCRKLHEVLSSADAIIAHNGDQYDIKFTETRMLANGLKPLPPIPSIDTLATARRRFLFNSNSLDYLGQLLKVGRKKVTPKGLWLKVLQGDTKAIASMVAYNKQDVLLLERVFNKLRPYVPNHINRQLFEDTTGCPRCGSRQVQHRGTHRAISRTYLRFQCQQCFGWFRQVKASGIKPTTRVL
jgi:hypothetical protein